MHERSKWKKTRFRGVRYYEHPERKHGVTKDRYFAIRYQINGERREEGLGWASEGWKASDAALELKKLKTAAKTGEGPSRLAEKREIAEAKRREEAERKAHEAAKNITFGQYWQEAYAPVAEADKSMGSVRAEKALYRHWIAPVLADKPLCRVGDLDMEKIKRRLTQAGRSPRTMEYALALVRQVFNHATRRGVFHGVNPARKVKWPKKDNRRQRFLTPEEADRLLKALRLRSQQVHDMALIALHCGLRFGEVAGLTWGNMDLRHGLLAIQDAKAGRSRTAYMTSAVKQTLSGMARGNPSDLVFPGKRGKRIGQVSTSFDRTVQELGLNDGLEDPRGRVVFHTLRHTFASWQVQSGVPIYTVGKLLGHCTAAMTERYSHLAPDSLKQGVTAIESMSISCKRKVMRIQS